MSPSNDIWRFITIGMIAVAGAFFCINLAMMFIAPTQVFAYSMRCVVDAAIMWLGGTLLATSGRPPKAP